VCALFKAKLNLFAPVVCMSFYKSRLDSYIVAHGPGWLDPYIVEHYQLEVANDIFNNVGTSGLVILPHLTRSAAWHHTVELPGTIMVPVSDPQCWRYTLAECLHVLHALTELPTRTSCRVMIALRSGALETCTRALGICTPCCTGRLLGFSLCLRPAAHMVRGRTKPSHQGGKIWIR
jgi:hypothetical protein